MSLPIGYIYWGIQFYDYDLNANMKVIFTMSVLLYFFLSPFPSLSEHGIQNRKDTIKSNVVAVNVYNAIQGDSIPKNSININGKLNAVSITNEIAIVKNLETDGKQKNITNAIEINGVGNSVSINQDNKDGSVKVQQNGTGNQVIISQSNQNKVK